MLQLGPTPKKRPPGRTPDKGSRLAAERVCNSFLKRSAAEPATRQWKDDTAERNGGEIFRAQCQAEIPATRPEHTQDHRGLIYHLLNGHVMTVPFFKEK